MSLFDRILAARGLEDESKRAAFLSPDYNSYHDPFLMNDIDKAVNRLVAAHRKQEKIVIYGDYDIDGLTATTLLLDAFNSFGFNNVDVFIPNRFTEGYGLNIDAVETIAKKDARLIVTVDCGSVSHKEIIRANELGLDVIVTDHHAPSLELPPAVAVINPKRLDNKYPFSDLAGVGVAFKLVQALQSRLAGLEAGQEKWLLDLVGLGTVCDVVSLVDENRLFVYWGLKVLAKTRRPGLKSLMAVAGVEQDQVNTRALGFGLGPRMNAAGRLETATHALELLTSTDPIKALENAEYLDFLNKARRLDQDKIVKAACNEAEKCTDPVLVLSDKDWSQGIVGIVASKLLEKYKKPTFVMQELGEEAKGSGRSYGDFSAIAAIDNCRELLIKGGGHKLAAGVTLSTKNIPAFRKAINKFYKSLELVDQPSKLLPQVDALAELDELTEELISQINQLEPFGNGNLKPVLQSEGLVVESTRKMGENGQHIKMGLRDNCGNYLHFLAFNAPEYFDSEPGTVVNVCYHVDLNEWRGNRSVEGQLLRLEVVE